MQYTNLMFEAIYYSALLHLAVITVKNKLAHARIRKFMIQLKLADILQPGLTEINRLPSRAPLQSVTGDEGDPLRQMLDGAWRFHLAAKPAAAPDGWQTSDTQTTIWRDITVPGVWTMQDTGDLPMYCNVQMPFADPHEPPFVPEENPTGLYRTVFTCPQSWDGCDVILHIGGAETVALIWCNGRFVGMGKDSRLPSEFDITPQLVSGENQLAVMVIKWSDASWIEDQDQWRHGGIHRSVFVEARAKTRIDDVIIVADFDADTGQGALHVRTQVAGLSDGYKIAAQLVDVHGIIAAVLPATDVAQFPHDASLMVQSAATYGYPGHEAAMDCKVAGVMAWTAETPYLYGLTTSLIDPAGNVCETQLSKIGFRRVEVRDRRLLINGRAIIILGVNRHDHHPENGKTCSYEDMRADLVLMKRHNINAIRTAHYPNDHRLLDLADELGFYVIGEANVECHARWKAVANDTRYQKAIIERTHRMILRDRNHPSIIGWSLGNEAGHGPAHDAAASLARRIDPTRFIHYEGAVSDRFMSFWSDATTTALQPPSKSERIATDLVCPMYPPLDLIVNWARWAEETRLDDRPLIMCEYSHAMGNSNGSLSEYVDAFFAEPALGGGFVWEWRDHGLAKIDDQGRFFWAYGGHYGEARHDGNFCCDGLVGPDLTPHPGLLEYKWAARPVTATWLGTNQVRLHNRQVFASTQALALHWSLQVDGHTAEQGQLETEIAAGSATDIIVPFETDLPANTECHLTLEWRMKQSNDWASAGEVLAWDQLALTPALIRTEPESIPAISVTETAPAGAVKQGDFTVVLSDGGLIESVAIQGRIIIQGDVTACIWRAPTDNDGVQTLPESVMPSRWREWLELGLDSLEMRNVRSRIAGNLICFERDWVSKDGTHATHRSHWRLSDHAIKIDEEIFIPETWPDIPRAGIRFEVPAGYEQLHWHGLGPDESYSDRFHAQTIGRWQSSVDAQYHAFPFPQEHGAHYQTRAFSLASEDGKGLSVELPQMSSFAARHHHDADLTAATTLADLVRSAATEVHIDAALRGMGTGACGPDTLPQYRAGSGNYRFSWILRGLQ